MDEAAFHDLISGRRRGLTAACLRGGLRVAALGFRAAVAGRNLAYDLGWRRAVQVGVPVVSLGNVTTGGTGKTPFAAYVAQWFRGRALRVAFLSRGYGADPGRVNDEALVLELLCPDVPHLQNPDRVAAARIAVEELESQVLVLDDGFQHRRIARDLDLVLLDATHPWGHGALLPRGLLREPRSALRRAGLVVLTRVDLVAEPELQRLRAEVARLRGRPELVEVAFPLSQLRGADGAQESLDAARGRRLAAFCGIGHPEGFRRSLAARGLEVAAEAFRAYPDHHAYRREDVEVLRAWAAERRPDLVLTTQKDLVKLALTDLAGVPLWSVEQGVEIRAGGDLLERALEDVARTCPPES